MVADHAENLGLAALIEESDPGLMRIAWGKKVHDLVKAGKPLDRYAGAETGRYMPHTDTPVYRVRVV